MSVPVVSSRASHAVLARLNPTTKLILAGVLTVALVISADAVTAGTILLIELAMLPWAGVTWRFLRRRLLAIATLGMSVLILNSAVSQRGGDIVLTLLGFEVREEALLAGCAAALRVMAIALPGVVLLATTDPTDLADALAQRWRLPERFVVGALVGFRLVHVLGSEWHTLGRARRARGLAGGTWRTFPGQMFALLVSALRRAARLARAVEARGFGVVPHRTWWRPSVLTRADHMARVLAITVAVGAPVLSLLLGTWRALGS